MTFYEDDQHQRNAEAFAQMMTGTPQEAEKEQEERHIPAAPSAPETRIVHDMPTRKSTAQQFADLLSFRGF